MCRYYLYVYACCQGCTHVLVHPQHHPVFSQEKKWRSETHTASRCRQEQPIWILATQRLATVNYIHQSSTIYWLTDCVLFLPSRGKQEKKSSRNEYGVWFDSNCSGYYAVICIICTKGMRTLGESWLEKLSQWIHISAAADWTWNFPNEPRGHMKSLQMMRKKRKKEK